jgi:hypothetical protein
VERVDHLETLIERLRPSVEEALAEYLADVRAEAENLEVDTVQDAVVGAAERLVGTAIADDTLATPSTGLDVKLPREFEEPDIVHVEVDQSSIVRDVYDRYEGDTLAWQVWVTAVLNIEGFVPKSDYYAGLPKDVEVLDTDWNDHYVLASVEREVELLFNVLTVSGQVEDVTLDSVEPT